MTPRKFHALHAKFRAREERQDRRFAVMYCMYANSHRDEKKKPSPFTLDDFIGPQKSNMTAEEYFAAEARTHMSAEQQVIMAQGYTAAARPQ